MTLLLFIAVLLALILVHEFGHFLAAKAFGIRVDEFGVGFPPKIAGVRKGETEYTVNALPFGGFVRIWGEDPAAVSAEDPDASRSFVGKPRAVQAFVLAAGILCNLLFAWGLLSLGYAVGMPTSKDSSQGGSVTETRVVILAVSEGSPAERAGIESGDVLVSITAKDEGLAAPSSDEVRTFIAGHPNETLSVTLLREEGEREVSVRPEAGLAEGRSAIGVLLDEIGVVKLPLHEALITGGRETISLTKDTAVGIVSFLGQALTGRADFSTVAGPVGIAGTVGATAAFGFVPLLSLVALISINLALINLIPIPALDGGRLLFVLVEALKGSSIRPALAQALNLIGFALLLLLMAVVTYHDIARIVS